MERSPRPWRRTPTRLRKPLCTSKSSPLSSARAARTDHWLISSRPARSLSRHLASRLAPDGINVNTLALGPFPSKMMAATLDKFKDDIVRGIPLGRVGEPSDVVGACLWLSGKAGQFITGATVPIEGGHLIAAKL
jgi:hypothetical protein